MGKGRGAWPALCTQSPGSGYTHCHGAQNLRHHWEED